MAKSTNNCTNPMLLGALAILAIAPATAFAGDSDSSGTGGCTYTVADGHNMPLHNGQDASVDGKIVSCRRGSIVVTTPPTRGSDVRGPFAGGNLPVLPQAGITRPNPLKTPMRPLPDTVPILIATP